MRRQSHHHSAKGFSVIELLLVLAIIGILSAIAIPAYLGQRQRARRTVEAEANAKVLAMMLETRKAETATYGPAAAYTWTTSGGVPSSNIAPGFTPHGTILMTYKLDVTNNGLAYTLVVSEKRDASFYEIYKTDQTGRKL